MAVRSGGSAESSAVGRRLRRSTHEVSVRSKCQQRHDGQVPATSAAASFFEALSHGGPHPLLTKARGALRFDVRDGERIRHWLVRIDRGEVSVSRRRGAADCVVRSEAAVFDRLATGEVNALVALLRGELTVEGDPEFFVLFQRVFPAPRAEVSRA